MKDYNHYLKEVGEVGYVRAVNNSMIYASGIPSVRINEIVMMETGQRGIAQSLLPDTVEILMLDGRPVRYGTPLVRTGEILKVPVGEYLLGRSVDAFMNPIDGKTPFPPSGDAYDFDNPAPPIYERAKINEPFDTGVMVVDKMVPLGRGQRELVIGDQKSGKTAFLLQAILSQAAMGTICIYTAIGKKKSEIKRISEMFAKQKCTENIIVVAADASSPASYMYIAPFTATSIAEYFREMGREVLLVFDDLNKHAKTYREIALLAKKSPGREAYPGDIFYLHSHLLERAGKKIVGTDKKGAAAITVLAVIETVAGDFTGYIQTNAMSITDGHIFFDIDTFNTGQRPAVNVSLSVSRVGRQTQSHLEKEFTTVIHTILSDYRHALSFARFGVELNDKTRDILETGEKVSEVFQQEDTVIVPKFLQNLYFGLLFEGFWKGEPKGTITLDKNTLAQAYAAQAFAPIEQAVAMVKSLDEFRAIIKAYIPQIKPITQAHHTQVVQSSIATPTASDTPPPAIPPSGSAAPTPATVPAAAPHKKGFLGKFHLGKK